MNFDPEILPGNATLYCGDCLDVLPTLAENSIDACVCDPPYHLTSIVKRFGKADIDGSGTNEARARAGADAAARLSRGFMGKQWDGGDIAFRPETWREVYRVLKPGAHLLACGGTRTYHRMACAIEDAGFEVRDCVQWLYGSGFPKSHDVSKGIDRAAGMEREVVGRSARHVSGKPEQRTEGLCGSSTFAEKIGMGALITAPATDAARQWDGWGTALKPSHEDVVLAQKPHDLRSICEVIVGKLGAALCELPLCARDVGNNSALRQSVFGTADRFGSVQWNAVLACSTPDDLFALMGTLQSESEIPSSLNIALSWLNTLVDLWRHESTFITETKTSLITDLKILNCLLSKNTAGYIIQAATQKPGMKQSVSLVEQLLSAVEIRLKITDTLSAHANASGLDVTNCQQEGVSLTPNVEMIVLARKPLSEKTVAANVLRWGCGALNIDGCRIGVDTIKVNGWKCGGEQIYNGLQSEGFDGGSHQGRWPANVIHDGSDEVVGMFPDARSSGNYNAKDSGNIGDHVTNFGIGNGTPATMFTDSGSAARFFYTAKADTFDRIGSLHPTVKPLDLMQYLVRLICPPGGTVLDPFGGTGTTGEAAWREGMRAVLIEREAEYQADIRRRMKLALAGPDERSRETLKASGKANDDPGPLFAGMQNGV